MPLNFLKHILDECRFLEKDSSKTSYEAFLNNDALKRAFVRSIEIIGEATKNIDPQFKSKHPEFEWKKMAGMRDRLIHAYFDVNYKIVWDIAINKVPVLIEMIEKILRSEEK